MDRAPVAAQQTTLAMRPTPQQGLLLVLLWFLCCAVSACHIHLDTEGRISGVQCLNGVRTGMHVNTSCLNKETGEQEQCTSRGAAEHNSGYRHECKIHYTKEKDKNYDQLLRTYNAWLAAGAFYSPGLDVVGIREGLPFWKDSSQVLYSFRCSSDMQGAVGSDVLFSLDRNASLTSMNSTLRASGLTIYVDNHVRFLFYLQIMAGVLLLGAVCFLCLRWLMMIAISSATDADLESQMRDQDSAAKPTSALAQSVVRVINNIASRRKPNDKRM